MTTRSLQIVSENVSGNEDTAAAKENEVAHSEVDSWNVVNVVKNR